MADVTRLLDAAEAGDARAAAELWPLVYEELRCLAATKLAQEKPGHTLDATALVHEAYLRLVASRERERPVSVAESPVTHAPGSPGFANRRHFFAAAAEAMRRILIESARRKGRIKHGGLARRAETDPDELPATANNRDLIDLHEALEKFAAHDPLKARLVELRFFAGLTLSEAAECLEISLSTADRAWKYARAWLYSSMDQAKKTDPT